MIAAADSSDVSRNVRSLNVSRLNTERSSSRAVNEKNRLAIANVVMPIVRASSVALGVLGARDDRQRGGAP